MNTIRLAAATLNTTPLDWSGNLAKIQNAIQQAEAAQTSVLCLPELCISGYGCEDMFLSPNTLQIAMSHAKKAARTSKTNMIFTLGLPVAYKGSVYNGVAICQNWEIIGIQAKAHLAGDGVHYEPRWFKAWPAGKISNIDGIPFGDIIVESNGVRIGFEICEDAWVAERPGHRLAQEGVDIILNPSASHFAFGKIETRKRFVMEGSRAFHCAYVYANLTGNESGRTVYDGGAMIACCGEMKAMSNRLTMEGQLITSDISINLLRAKQAASASRRIREGDTLNIVTSACIPEPLPIRAPRNPEPEAWESSPDIKEEEFTRAIALALYDYNRKCGTKGFVVSLSGGADSAAVCALIYYMAKLTGQEGDMANILTTVYQGTPQSSDETRSAAAKLAGSIGCKHHCVDVGEIVDSYTNLYAKASGKELNWETDDIALQNIQARARGPMAWMFANVENKLLLATSNRSEAAVGYATMDGDTCGALSPLAGIDKTFLRHWLRWAYKTGPEGLGTIPGLSGVVILVPTAELRPANGDHIQSDEEDLMPYPILGEIENLLIRDKLAPFEALLALAEKFPDEDDSSLSGYIRKFQTLWRRNQWKRERYAPGIHVDDKNLDPKSWCRYPLLSGEP